MQRPALNGDIDVDVAIVGAVYTGLWAAYYLAASDPSLKVAVLERDIVGFGASGRNGGWYSEMFAASPAKIARTYGKQAEERLRNELEHTVDEIGAVTANEGIDCHFKKGGRMMLARSSAQLLRARQEIDEARSFCLSEDDLVLLGRSEAWAIVGATDVLGAVYSPHCASVHPARLACGLA